MSNVWKNWQDLGSDCNWQDYGGKWGRKDPSNPRVWYVIRHENLIDCMGERDVEESGCDPHVSDVYRVDLDATAEDTIASALQYCGVDLDDLDPEYHDVAIVESLVSYGAAAPMGTYTDKSYPERARAAARRAAEELIADSDACEEALNRPVNRLGSTAAEYARGDFAPAIERGVLAGEPNARLTARIHGVDQWAIDDARPADFLPYVAGYATAMAGGAKESGDDIAPEYFLGYERGERVRKGEAPAPGWIKQR